MHARFLDAPLLAHEGGWDEILLVVAPIILLYLGLRWWGGRTPGDDRPEHDEDPGA